MARLALIQGRGERRAADPNIYRILTTADPSWMAYGAGRKGETGQGSKTLLICDGRQIRTRPPRKSPEKRVLLSNIRYPCDGLIIPMRIMSVPWHLDGQLEPPFPVNTKCDCLLAGRHFKGWVCANR